MTPWLAIGVWALYLILVAPPCYRAWRSSRLRPLRLPGPADLASPTITELQPDEWRLT